MTMTHQATLLETLATLPNHWQIVPTNGNKMPLGCQWQLRPFTPQRMLNYLSNNGTIPVLDKNLQPIHIHPQGIGLLTGSNSKEFLMAMDADGESAHQKILSKGKLPQTIAFTSGRPGRAQYLFSLKCSTDRIRSRRITTAPREALELRGNGLQSVLPPSPHPITGSYKWLPRCSPSQTEVAIAPDWLVDEMLLPAKHPTKSSFLYAPPSTTINGPSKTSISLEQALLLLEVIHPKFADDYTPWIFTGMALKYISPSLLEAWDNWSQLSPKYNPGECTDKWQSFRGHGITEKTLIYYAIHS